MEYTLSEAAEATGVGRSTLHRAIQKGRLSARRLEDGSFRIDASELARVYPPSQPKPQVTSPWEASGQKETDRDGPEMVATGETVLRVEVRMLRDQLERERELRAQELERIERERETTRETVEDLRRRLDRAEERILALAAPVTQAPAETLQGRPADPHRESTPAPKTSRGVLARLFGRA